MANLHSSASRLLVLLDRDGVINEDVGSPGVIDGNQLELTPHAGHAMGRLRPAGCAIATVTNQSCVGKQLVTRTRLHNKIFGRLQQLLHQQDVDATWNALCVCETTTAQEDPRRKPAPDMIHDDDQSGRAFEDEQAIF